MQADDEAFAAKERRPGVSLRDHAVLLYEGDDDLVKALGAYVREGVTRGELNVFVHAYAQDDEAWAALRRGYGGSGPPEGAVIVVALYKSAFQGSGPRIDQAHVEAVVEEFVQRAAREGHAGTRIFVDASRRYLSAGRAEEWFAFERWLGRRLQARVALVCAYPRATALDPVHVARVLETHAYRFEPQ